MKNLVLRGARRYQQQLPYAVWGLSLAAMAGSLAMSEMLHWVPCVLCWWQRILMYPLVVIVGVGILRGGREWAYYTLPLAAAGMVVAFYQSLLQWGILPEAVAPCNAYVSCVTKQLNWFGFVTVPFMSLVAFAAIVALTSAYVAVGQKPGR